MDIDYNLDRYIDIAANAKPLILEGRVVKVVGLVIESEGPAASVGDLCYIFPSDRDEPIEAEVVGFHQSHIQLMPLGPVQGLTPGCRVVPQNSTATVQVGQEILGRVINGLGYPIDDLGPIKDGTPYPIYCQPSNPLTRASITEPIDVGVRSINALHTIAKGQRVGIFSGSGVGKSTLLSMISRHTQADVNVIALIGERGREVKEFIKKGLGPEGMKRSVVIAATSDQPALVRIRGAFVATAVAEYFRDQGADVILMMDSTTRFAHASREVGLSIGEPPTTRGYTPSVFAQLPLLLERAGNWRDKGSITGLYTVLVEGDDINEPLADALMSILDGHIILKRELAARNRYPAVDPLISISRLMIDVVEQDHLNLARRFSEVLATYTRAEDMINIGAYIKGSSPEIDYAIKVMPRFEAFLKQTPEESVSFLQAQEELKMVFS
ncbi:MAG: FliI/YscN family ATPase [Deltaproteobacteria bacterium]|nr:FliI/YscN family ATPase [Deltaproteobacteria bacterium]MBW2053754.1 FliI/YscN family ATPase [Deltaproteobacteria bacterium]MBW2142383.1 FliI/YscN family ATPase [Deltaproteobacteria bacterium]MBW2324242.1 FliI/YscN family ATPase [Deltaproteobacteria bacterium]